MKNMVRSEEFLSIVVVGGSGNLARTKIYPALFALYCQGFLPENTHIFGFARTELSDSEFRHLVSEHLTCRYTPDHSCAERTNEFLESCHYVSGRYGAPDSFLDLYQTMKSIEPTHGTSRIFYLAIPPSVFLDAAHAIGSAGLVQCNESEPSSRVVVEKPFGRDRESSDLLSRELAKVFTETQTFRIDHYLGKEAVQNLLVLRFANLIFEPVWNSRFIESVSIVWKERQGVEGRGGYFDKYGIIRDVMQNHLIQMMSLIAMDSPADLNPASIAREKVRVLRCIQPVRWEEMVLGQYATGTRAGKTVPGYVDDDSVASNSVSPTYASATLRIDSDRWKGVPFKITAGKGLDENVSEIRIRFRELQNNLFCKTGNCPEANELVIRIQPDEAIGLRLTNKVPGMGMQFATKELDLHYKQAFNETIPDAYESLILDVIRNDRSLFITRQELETAWDIFTPILHEIERRGQRPAQYPFGGDGSSLHSA